MPVVPVARPDHDDPAGPIIEGEEPTVPRRRIGGSARWIAAAAAVAMVAGLLWATTRSGTRPPASLARALQGTLVYASAGEDGTTGRLWLVNAADGTAAEGPWTILPDQIVASGEDGSRIGVSVAGAAYVFPDLVPTGEGQLLAEGRLVAWSPGGASVFVVRSDPVRSGCPAVRIVFVDARSRADEELYREPTCSVPDGLAVDGLTRAYLSLPGDGRTKGEVFHDAGAARYGGVFELGYKELHRVVPGYLLLGVSPVGDLLVGPRIPVPTGGVSSAVVRTLLVWKGIGGPTVVGTATQDLRAERLLAWSSEGHRAGVLGTLGDTRGVWLFDIDPGVGRQRPRRVGPPLAPEVDSVGATFAGEVLIATEAGRVYASTGRGYREVELPDGAPPPSGPILWLAR